MYISIDNNGTIISWNYNKEDIVNMIYTICLEELAIEYKRNNIHYTEQLDYDETEEKIRKVFSLFVHYNKIHKYLNISHMEILYAIIDKFYIASGAKEAIYKDYPYLVNSSSPYTYFIKIKDAHLTE